MGIRVHKVLGYGTRGFEPTPVFQRRYEEVCEGSLSDFLEWAYAHLDDIAAVPEPHRRTRTQRAIMEAQFTGIYDDSRHFEPFSPVVVHEDEFGVKDALLIVPPEHVRRWNRHDDTIDWVEETLANGNHENRFVSVGIGLYPNEKGQTPLSVAAVCLYLGIPEVFSRLSESLYVYWA